MVFPVVMYGCESWTIKKTEHQKIDGFELWCWRRLLRVPWTARRSNQSDLKEISPGCSLEGWCWSWNSNTLAIWCKELTHMKRPWCWEGLRAGGEGDDRGWDGWMASPTRWMWVWVDSGSWWWTGRLACCGSWDHKELDMTEWLNWIELNYGCLAHQSAWENTPQITLGRKTDPSIMGLTQTSGKQQERRWKSSFKKKNKPWMEKC